VFEESVGRDQLQADGVISFVIGSAIKHPHPLVSGQVSVHTNEGPSHRSSRDSAMAGGFRAEGRL